ncbi:MAG: hypothetical protein HOE90_13675 [Bacteriovoracaceae bacterium]|nr:hypothetical protein [Bacteriovoracaceae bacterium]
MKILVVILCLSFLSSCKKPHFLEVEFETVDFENAIYPIMFGSVQVVSKAESLKNQIGVIDKPEQTWQNVLEFTALTPQFFHQVYCLNYKIPRRINLKDQDSNLGILELHKLKGENCESTFFTEPLYSLEKIEWFSYALVAHNFKMAIKRAGEKNESQFKMKFRSIIREAGPRARYSSYARNAKKLGMQLASIGKKKKLTIKLFDPAKKGQICQKFVKDCAILEGSWCESCPYSVVPIMRAGCTEVYEYMCTPKNCGEPSMPACMRGHYATGVEKLDMCKNSGKVGFCRDGSAPFCNREGELFCH